MQPAYEQSHQDKGCQADCTQNLFNRGLKMEENEIA